MKKVLLLVLLVVAAGTAFYFLRPLFVDDVVDEDLPEGLTSLEDLSLEQMDDKIELPTIAEIAAMTDEEKEAAEMALIEQAEKMQVSVNDQMEEQVPDNSPKVLLSGRFADADDFHKGSGNVRIIQIDESERIARLENFSVTNGPDLFVYLTKHPNPKDGSDVQKGFVNLGRLKGNKGNQNYTIPEDVNLSEYNSIVIYCKAFSVLFSPASLF